MRSRIRHCSLPRMASIARVVLLVWWVYCQLSTVASSMWAALLYCTELLLYVVMWRRDGSAIHCAGTALKRDRTALKWDEVVTSDFDRTKVGPRTKVYRTQVGPPLYALSCHIHTCIQEELRRGGLTPALARRMPMYRYI